MGSISASISAKLPGQVLLITCTFTSCRAGRETRILCPCWAKPPSYPSPLRNRPRVCGRRSQDDGGISQIRSRRPKEADVEIGPPPHVGGYIGPLHRFGASIIFDHGN